MDIKEELRVIKERAMKRARDEFFNKPRVITREEYEKRYGNN